MNKDLEIMTKDLEIASMKEQIEHQIGLEIQAGIPKSSSTPIPLEIMSWCLVICHNVFS